jgi:hypothetical protein
VTAGEGFPPVLLARARIAGPGVCICCACTDAFGCSPPCWWEPGTNERLCSNHTEVEKRQARAAIATADAERAAPARKAVRRA